MAKEKKLTANIEKDILKALKKAEILGDKELIAEIEATRNSRYEKFLENPDTRTIAKETLHNNISTTSKFLIIYCIVYLLFFL